MTTRLRPCQACYGTGRRRAAAGGGDCRKCRGAGWVKPLFTNPPRPR
jgi:DnaJ-class molecular chaperone